MNPDPFAIAADLIDPPTTKFDQSPGALAVRLEPTTTVQTPALELIDDHLCGVKEALEAMYERRSVYVRLQQEGVENSQALLRSWADVPQRGIERLIISMPPQEGKTERVSRRGMLWFLQQFRGMRGGIVSYDAENAQRISYGIKLDVETYSGEEGLPDLGLRLVYGQKAMGRWFLASPHEGGIYATGIKGPLTGKPLDLLIIDDPVKDVEAADSLLLSTRSWEWWSSVALPRLAPGAPAIIVATRWHEADLSGRLIMKQEEDEALGIENYERWHVVNIPAQAETDEDPLGREPGEFMISARGRSQEQWETRKQSTPPRHWLALYQGKPSPDEGEIWLKPWWRRYNEAKIGSVDNHYEADCDVMIQSWDCTFKGTSSSDYVVGQVWGKWGADSYLLYEVWKRMSFTETIAAIQRVTKLFPQAHRKVIEEAANGAAVIDSLRKKIPGITPCTPYKSKIERANAVAPFIQAGNVHIPTSTVAIANPDVAWDPEGFIVETASFPNGANDDQVDAASQALAQLYLGSVGTATVTGSDDAARIPLSPGGGSERHAAVPEWQKRIARRQRV